MSSPGSYYSTASNHPEPVAMASASQIPTARSPSERSERSNVSNLEDIDVWLAHPENQAMVQSLAKKTNLLKRPASESASIDGVDNPSKALADLHALCQKKNIEPVFEIQEKIAQRFTGCLIVGSEEGHKVELTVGMKSKKEAKAWLAQQAIPIISGMSVQTRESSTTSTKEEAGQSWQLLTVFNQKCQIKGVEPKFDIQEKQPQRFNGSLKVGDHTINLEHGVSSKKEARAWLAQEALPILDQLSACTRSPPSGQPGINWIGKLHEYTQSVAVPPSLTYDFASPPEHSQRFYCTLTIDPSPLDPSGKPWVHSTLPMATKKASKSAAAEQAVAALIQTNNLAPDGSPLKMRCGSSVIGSSQSSPPAAKPSDLPGIPAPESPPRPQQQLQNHNHEREEDRASPAARVAAMATKLGLPPPTYELAPPNPANPSILSGGAWFKNRPLKINGEVNFQGGPIGVVTEVFGRKKAKEECARGVLQFLEELMAERLKGVKFGIS